MEWIEVTGGRPLAGRIRPAAAKNSVLPLLAATLLCAQPCTLRGVPPLADVRASLALLEAVGAAVRFAGGCVYTAPRPVSGRVPPGPAAAMRGSVFYLAPLLVRAGRVELPLPGGCCLGPRPIDIHLDGLSAMGAHVETRPAAGVLRRRGALHAVDYTLRLPSVGATLTLMMAAACAQGHSILRGAACEPEIADAAAFLNAAGAQIEGAGTPVLLEPFLNFLSAAGCTLTAGAGDFTVARDPAAPLRGGAALCTGAWPGFATDTAPLAAAVLLAAQGASTVHDSLFENRFACAAGFAALGAGTQARGRDLVIPGGAALHGAAVTAPDLRGGAALVTAALGAAGRTLVADPGHIRRGYADLPGDLAALGARCRYLAPQEAEKIVEVP